MSERQETQESDAGRESRDMWSYFGQENGDGRLHVLTVASMENVASSPVSALPMLVRDFMGHLWAERSFSGGTCSGNVSQCLSGNFIVNIFFTIMESNIRILGLVTWRVCFNAVAPTH